MKLDVFFTFKKCGNVGFRPVLAEQKPRRDSKLLTLNSSALSSGLFKSLFYSLLGTGKTYLISRFFFMIQQTKEFPMILTEVIIKKTTVMAKAADVDIMKFKSVRVPDLKNNEQVNKWSSK